MASTTLGTEAMAQCRIAIRDYSTTSMFPKEENDRRPAKGILIG
jgi:hypothetical protein